MSSGTPALGQHACVPACLAPVHAASMQCPGNAPLASSSSNTTSCPLVPTRRETSPCQALRPHKRRRVHTAAAAPGAAAAAATTTTKARASSSPVASGTASAEGKDGKGGTWMIVGLGNPGANYDNTRHNIGFVVVDRLAKAEGIEVKKLEKSAAVGRGEICGKPVLLVKPVTFMNNSGESVAALAKFYKVPHSRVLVISDDLDMPTASVRLRQKGGHGGHNGLRSIIQHFGNSMEFPRIKIGIGRPSGPMPIASYVLQDFSKREAEEVAVAVEESVAIVRSILSIGLEKALSGQRA